MIARLAVFERGEPAARIVRAVAGLGVATVVVVDADAPPGEPWWAFDADDIWRRTDEDPAATIASLAAAGIEAIWPGSTIGDDRIGFLRAAEAADMTVVSPNAPAVESVLLAPAGRPAGERERTIELDLLVDRAGTVWTFPPRSVTALVAESPATGVDAAVLADDAAALIRHAGYVGAATVIYAVGGGDWRRTGVDVVVRPDHALTEEQTGLSVIGQRVRVAAGELLSVWPPRAEGHVIEGRLLATASGHIAQLGLPLGTGVRVDADRRLGDPVDAAADPTLAVVTAWGPDAGTARSRLRRAVERTTVVVAEGATNRATLLAAIDGRKPVWPADPLAVLVAAVEAYEADREIAEAAFIGSAEQGRPQRPEDVGRRVELTYRGQRFALQVDRTGQRDYRVQHDRDVAYLRVERVGAFERRVTTDQGRRRAIVTRQQTDLHVDLDGAAHVVGREDGSVLRSGYPALVVEVLVNAGDTVRAGQPVVVLESMKMESTVVAPVDGTVVAVTTGVNVQIERGAPLLRIRPDAPVDHADERGEPISLDGFGRLVDPGQRFCERVYGPLADYLLGYDLPAAELRRLLTEQRRAAEIAAPDDAALLACEDGLLDVFADLGALSRPRGEHDDAETQSTQEYLLAFVQWLDADRAGLPPAYRERLTRALGRYGVVSLEDTSALRAALMWLWRSLDRLSALVPVVTAILQRRLAHVDALAPLADERTRDRLDRLARAADGRQPIVADLARDVRFRCFDDRAMARATFAAHAEMAGHLAAVAAGATGAARRNHLDQVIACPYPLRPLLLDRWRATDDPEARAGILEAAMRRYYRIRDLRDVRVIERAGRQLAVADYDVDGKRIRLVMSFTRVDELPGVLAAVAELDGQEPSDRAVVVDVIGWRESAQPEIDETAAEVAGMIEGVRLSRPIHRLDVSLTSPGEGSEAIRTQHVTFRQGDDFQFVEERFYRNLHPMLAKRLDLAWLERFELDRRLSPEEIFLFHGVARDNPKDRRLFCLAEVQDLDRVVDGERTSFPRLERTAALALGALRTELARYAREERPTLNRLVLDVRPAWTLSADEVRHVVLRLAPLATGLDLDEVTLRTRDGELHIEDVGAGAVRVRESAAATEPLPSLSPYQQKVLLAARFGAPYPYEITRMLTPGAQDDSPFPRGDFVELDLDDTGDGLVPVERPAGQNEAHLVVGLLTAYTDVVPEGVRRVALLSDPTQGLGNLAEPECRRINAALAYALEHRLPVEWFAVSSGALIAMDSGTENMDWIALTLRRLIEFTQAGGEINIIVTGINVGGQPYWNAEATMLMHTKGILVMTPASTMVLTGKQALDFSGAVSAEDNFGIGGYDRVMGPNGQAQYWAPTFPDACQLLLDHYDLTYVVPGERFPRRRPTTDPTERDIGPSPHAALADSPFRTVGDIFSDQLNGERKHPFDMRSLMRAVVDADSPVLERWKDLRDGDTSIVWDATVGGIPVCLLGLESHSVSRKGFVPSDGPPAWTSGTLFPHSSRKTARAVNACSGNRPLVVLANLSGFDGSPESMRRRQLEYGAEIGRAVTNFDGPIVFVVVSRYHGGAFVVFSKALNSSMEIAAVEGSFASVIGGAPAAATVFAREVKQRTERDDRVATARATLAAATGDDVGAARRELAARQAAVRAEKLGEVADEFDAVHTIERARRVGSVDRIIPAAELRPYIVDALVRGMDRVTA